MSVLVGKKLKEKLKAPPDQRLYVTPILEDDQIKQSGIDLRLGNQFIVFRNAVLEALNPAMESRDVLLQVLRYQERVVIPFLKGSRFVLHPGQLVIGSTFEYVALPQNLEARIDSRSSFARLGLTVAGAISIAPGFKGVITLELTNHGSTPIVLYPGWPIAQLVVSETIGKAPYQSRKYLYPVGPQFSRLYEDESLRMWARPASQDIALNVKGMTCEHCVNTVKKAVSDLKGVKNVKVDLESGTVSCRLTGECATRDDVARAIAAAGYDVVHG